MSQTSSGRQYQNVTEGEFDGFMDSLANYEKQVPSGASEIVYDVPLPADNLVVRVWSTLVGGHGRGKGKDAIRAVIWDTDEDRPVGGREKTLRIAPTASNPEGWKGNLRPKIQDLVRNWREFDKECPECGRRMVVRDGQGYDPFWGCTGYSIDACSNTEPYEG